MIKLVAMDIDGTLLDSNRSDDCRNNRRTFQQKRVQQEEWLP